MILIFPTRKTFRYRPVFDGFITPFYYIFNMA